MRSMRMMNERDHLVLDERARTSKTIRKANRNNTQTFKGKDD